MDAVEDVLHLLDVYSGHEWAASLLSDEARAVLRS